MNTSRSRTAFLCLTLTSALTGVQPLLAAEPSNPSVTLRPFHIEVSHDGDPGGSYASVFSTDLMTWWLMGPTTEIAPGRFAFEDSSVIKSNRGFYRVADGLDPALLDWQLTYPIEYLDGMGPDQAPLFFWHPLPGGATSYRFELYAAVPDGDGGHVPAGIPLVSKPGLLLPGYEFTAGDALPVPGGMYAWRVIAVTPALLIPGRFVIIPGMGPDAVAEDPIGPAPLKAGRRTPKSANGPPNWPQVFETLRKMAEQKEAIRKAFNENPLVAETKLLEQLLNLLQNHDELKSALEALLNSDPTQLANPDTLLKALCYLDSLLEFVDNFDKNLTAKQRKALKRFAAAVKAHKENLEKAADRQALVDAILQDLGNFLNPTSEEGSAIVEYLKGAITDKLIEKIKEMLVKKLGEKAAGALISIISDLVSFGDALLKLNELEDLCREYNRLLLAAIACDDGRRSGTGRKYHGSISEKKLNCNVTLSYHRRCFVKDADGGPNDGHWADSPVSFSDGSTSKTKSYASIATGPGSRPGRIAFECEVTLNAADLTCPPGQGPCLLYLLIQVRCPQDQSLNEDVALFSGVIKC